MREKLSAWFSLFASSGTLVCCALPALFVALGFGAAFAGLVEAVPQMVWLSEHKGAVFAIGAVMLTIAGYLQWRARFDPCPVDPRLAAACMSGRRWSRRIFLLAVVIYAIGAFFAFVLGR
jgi:hypothetical protein